MATIQVVLDDALLALADRVAEQQHVNRSTLIRDALRAHLKKLCNQELAKQEREAYERQPDELDGVKRWERVTEWPDD